jgi:hypothetical protein
MKKNAYLTRLVTQFDQETHYRVGMDWHEPDDCPPVRILMGAAGEHSGAWWELPLPPCPDCKDGKLVWAEGGWVPGARECIKCGSLFSISAGDVGGDT